MELVALRVAGAQDYYACRGAIQGRIRDMDDAWLLEKGGDDGDIDVPIDG
jgi:hypothetical protein